MTDYLPIDCNYYDELEALATLRKDAEILYLSEADEALFIISLIKDFFIQDKVEFMVLANGLEIRLDRIVSVNGLERPGNSFCAVV
jgi:Rho-binding antiterminator